MAKQDDIDWDSLPAAQAVEDAEHVLDVDPSDEVLATSYEITSYGADYPVDGLIKRLNQNDIVVPSFDPTYEGDDEIRGFQRSFVWTRPQMDRFVESLLLGLPVPGVFLVRDKANILLVLDGQQRLRTLHAYYRGIHSGREYRLRYVQPPFVGKSYETLDDEDRRRLDDSIIHATVLRQEHPAGSQDAVYSIFERLNTGGSPLQPQEIRVALYSGPFLKLINELNSDAHWRSLYGAPSGRFKDQEMILRVFAMYEEAESYARPLKIFLNHYLANNRDRDAASAADLTALFLHACEVLDASVGTRAFRPTRPINAAVIDSVMVGVMRRLERGPIKSLARLETAYGRLLDNANYLDATISSTAAEDSVQARLSAATKAFARVV